MANVDHQEILDHMLVEPMYISFFPWIFKILYYPIYFVKQYKVTRKYWDKPVKHRFIWVMYYTFKICNLLIWTKVGNGNIGTKKPTIP